MDPDLDGHRETTPDLGLLYHVCHQLWSTNEMSSVALCHGPTDGGGGRVGVEGESNDVMVIDDKRRANQIKHNTFDNMKRLE